MNITQGSEKYYSPYNGDADDDWWFFICWLLFVMHHLNTLLSSHIPNISIRIAAQKLLLFFNYILMCTHMKGERERDRKKEIGHLPSTWARPNRSVLTTNKKKNSRGRIESNIGQQLNRKPLEVFMWWLRRPHWTHIGVWCVPSISAATTKWIMQTGRRGYTKMSECSTSWMEIRQRTQHNRL